MADTDDDVTPYCAACVPECPPAAWLAPVAVPGLGRV